MTGPELRIGDDDREAAVTALGEHYAAGRLTKDEYDERSQRAWDARTRSALTPLFADLPRAQARAATTPSRPGPEPTRPGHPGWWAGARFLPVLVVVGVLVVLTHLPVFRLLIAAWTFLARSGRHWPHRHHQAGQAGHPGRGWVR
ncbi:hypothetical protein BH10ACT10_BH10ACT10_15760 [soil metagenome]